MVNENPRIAGPESGDSRMTPSDQARNLEDGNLQTPSPSSAYASRVNKRRSKGKSAASTASTSNSSESKMSKGRLSAVNRTKEVGTPQTPLSTKGLPAESEQAEKDADWFSKPPNVQLADIGGLGRQIQSILDVIELPITELNLATALRLPPTRTILIHGQRGTGKTMVMNALVNELKSKGKVHPIKLDSAFLLMKKEGETEASLLTAFKEAASNAPSVIFFDDIDVLCESKKHPSDTEKRVTASLCNMLDKLPDEDVSKRITVIASTSRPDAIDSALRRPGRFDIELEFTVPLPPQRREILEKILASASHSLTPEQICQLADDAHSFTGADLMLMCREASLFALKDGQDKINYEYLRKSLKKQKPSAMRDIQLEVPKVFWSDIGGQHEVKERLKQAVVWPLQKPEAFIRMGVTPPKGVLMYGPPGCSKTLVGKALATESGLNFIVIKGPELFNKWVGESERAVRELFRKAKQASPSIVFFDEIDALATERSADSSRGSSEVGNRVLAQMLTELDGVEALEGVVVVAATNRPDRIDKALLRPGRLDHVIYVPLPDINTRREIFEITTRKMPLSFENDGFSSIPDALQKLASQTDGYSGAEIVAVCQEAGLLALEESLDAQTINYGHFHRALSNIKPRTSPELLNLYESYDQSLSLSKEFGRLKL